MKIQKVKIKDFKIIKDLEKEINGSNILLIGDNGVGKSSFIQFIEIALGKTTNIPPNALGSGEVIVDKDGKQYTFQVKFKDSKPIVTIISPDGLKDTRKGVLGTLVGAMEFDIDEFVELSKTVAGRKKQIQIFKSFLPTETQSELEKFEINVKAKFDERTELNRLIKTTEVEINGHEFINEITLKLESVDLKDVYAKLKVISEDNKKINDVQSRQNERLISIDKDEETILNLEKQISDLMTKKESVKKEIETNKVKNKDAEKWLKENPEKDAKVLEKSIETATETNFKGFIF